MKFEGVWGELKLKKDSRDNNSQNISLNENKTFRLTKICEKGRKDHIFICFCMFPFQEISYFLNFPSNKYVRKQHLSANVYCCVNMNFSYTIAVRKDEIFYIVLLRKEAIFHLRLGQIFADDI